VRLLTLSQSIGRRLSPNVTVLTRYVDIFAANWTFKLPLKLMCIVILSSVQVSVHGLIEFVRGPGMQCEDPI